VDAGGANGDDRVNDAEGGGLGSAATAGLATVGLTPADDVVEDAAGEGPTASRISLKKSSHASLPPEGDAGKSTAGTVGAVAEMAGRATVGGTGAVVEAGVLMADEVAEELESSDTGRGICIDRAIVVVVDGFEAGGGVVVAAAEADGLGFLQSKYYFIPLLVLYFYPAMSRISLKKSSQSSSSLAGTGGGVANAVTGFSTATAGLGVTGTAAARATGTVAEAGVLAADDDAELSSSSDDSETATGGTRS